MLDELPKINNAPGPSFSLANFTGLRAKFDSRATNLPRNIFGLSCKGLLRFFNGGRGGGRGTDRRSHRLLRIHRSYFPDYSDVLVLMMRTTRALRCEGNCDSKTQSRVIGFEARALSSVLWSQEQIRSVVTSINSRQYFCSMRNWLALDNPNREKTIISFPPLVFANCILKLCDEKNPPSSRISKILPERLKFSFSAT